MPYLIYKDYKKLIQSDNLMQIIGNDETVLKQMQDVAISEMRGYLVQKYDVAKEFTETALWDKQVEYKAKNRIYLNASAHNPSTTYSAGDLVLQAGSVYSAKTDISAAHAFDSAEWNLLGAQYDLFYVTMPYPEFEYRTVYKVGDQVWWKNKNYTCVIATVIPSHETSIQMGGSSSITNVFPDDSVQGAQYWGTGTLYKLTAGTLPTDDTKWTKGDNREQGAVVMCIDITLYHLHSRIAPRNIPDLRVKRYDDAKKDLTRAARGEITFEIPLLQPKQGQRIRYGGNQKLINSY